jgi:hypothetical protein
MIAHVITQLQSRYPNEILSITQIASTEINILIREDINHDNFIQILKDEILALVSKWSIWQFNILDAQGNLITGFATNQ